MNCSKEFPPRIPDDPLMTIEIKEPSLGLEGWVCVHALGKNGASGGVRCVGNVTQEEVKLLAKAMTYKFSFFGIPQGGAKAGLRLDYDVDPMRRSELIRAAARHLKPLVMRSSIWSPWTDMNFYGDDLRMFYGEMGRLYTPNKHYNSSHRTAISAFWSLEACMAFYELDPQETRVTIEGFGSVASYLAPFLRDAGVKVVAASNTRGMVYNQAGLNLDEIVQLREQHGSAWVEQNGKWKTGDRDDIFDIEADIMMPCARVHSIDNGKAERISARLLLPIANVPCTDEALQVLDRRKLDYIPDFVVNGGGVSGHIKGINDPFGVFFKSMFQRLLSTARTSQFPVRKVAEDAAHVNYGRIAADAYTTDPLTLKIVKRLAARGLAPGAIVKKIRKNNLDRLYLNMNELFLER